MRITQVAVFVATNDLRGKVWNPQIRWRTKYSVIVRIETDRRVFGIGECWCFDAAPDALIAYLKSEVIPRLVGADPIERDAIQADLWRTTTLSARHGIMASALSGIDIALWDIAAKAEGVPLYRLLGGKAGQVRLYASGGLYAEGKDAEGLAEELAGYLDAGFDWVKFKVGGLSVEEDAHRVLHVRKALGDGPALTIDGVYSYDVRTASDLCERVAAAKIHTFQSPVPADDIEGMEALANEHGVPVLALEAEYREQIIALLLERRAVSVLQLALVACGGISTGLRFAENAASHGIPCSLECSSTAIAQMAAFHLAAARQQIESVEYHMVHQVLFELFPFDGSAIANGILQLPDTPGLGLEVPDGLLMRCA